MLKNLLREKPVLMTVLVAGCLSLWTVPAYPVTNASGGARSLRLEMEGIGAIVARPPSIDSDGGAAQLLMEKPGGKLLVIASFEGLEFAALLSADLDGDRTPEVIAVARHRSGDDLMPFIFGGPTELNRIFPPGDGEDNPIMGKEISIIQGKAGAELCVKIPIIIHDFGPPDLFQIETYRLRGKQLAKTGEMLTEAKHFNQIMNRAAFAAQKGRYLDALKDYESVLGMTGNSVKLSPEAKAEALLAAADCRAGLKDFSTALELYRRVTIECPGSPQADKAGRESTFISGHISNPAILSLYTDIARANRMERWNEALMLLEKTPDVLKSPLGDHLMFQRGEALIGLGRVEEAIAVFKGLRSEFPRSTLAEAASERLQELEGAPESPESQ